MLRIMCGGADVAGKQSLLKERFLVGGFQLQCYALCLQGTCRQIWEALQWLPPFPLCEEGGPRL